LTANHHNLNILWTKIKEVLIITANKTVSCSFQSSEDRIPKPKILTSCYSALTKMNNILLKFRTKLITRSLWPNDHEWALHKETIQQLIEEHKLELAEFPQIITMANVRQIKKQLLTIFKLIYHKARLERRLLEQSQIQHNIKLRYSNYEEDLTKIIDSILNRERKV